MHPWAMTGVLLGLVCLTGTASSAQFADPLQRFALDPPPEWQVQPIADGSFLTILADPENKASLMVFVAETSETPELEALPAAYERLLKTAKPEVSLEVLGETRLEVAEHPALQRQYGVKGGAGPAPHLVATFVQAGRLSLTLVATAGEADYARFESAIQESIQSLRFSPARSQGTPSESSAKLQALEAAHEAGILTDEEYARKKAELGAPAQPAGPRADKALQERLQALMAAVQAGVLNGEEFARLKGEIAQQLAPAQEQVSTKKAGKTYRHPIGFTFWYPEGWTLQETNPLQLIPPDAGMDAQGPTEAYVILGSEAPGIGRPDDPRIVQFLESQLMMLIPTAQRAGEVEPVTTTSGPGALMTWEGTNMTGMQVRCCAYVVMLQGYGVALAGIGDKDRVVSRQPALREIFATFGLLESEKDPQVIGAWRYESFHSYQGPKTGPGDDFNSTVVTDWVFQADGNFRSGGQAAAIGGDVGVDTGQQVGKGGRWSTKAGRLYMIWGDGSYAEFQYHVEGAPGARNMLLVPADGKKQLWQEIR